LEPKITPAGGCVLIDDAITILNMDERSQAGEEACIDQSGPTSGPGPGQVASSRANDVPRLYALVLGLGGAAAIGAGIAALADSSRTVRTISITFGVYLLISAGLGAVRLVRRQPHERDRSVELLFIALNLIAGVIVIWRSSDSLEAMAIVLGLYLFMTGMLDVVERRESEAARLRWGRLLRAASRMLMGVIVLAWPSISLTTLSVVVGIGVIVAGVLICAEALGWQTPMRLLRRAG
jgi:uncharacterized membrane protein HdeD (DUF308 family)